MASVSSSTSGNSIYGALGIKNKGIGGLASGLDTDSLVTALVSGTTSRINKQTQQKQLLNWKMTAYRSAATQLKAFQSKHFDYTSSSNTNIMSSGFWNTFKATASSSKVTATASPNSTIGSITIDKVQQLATAETLTSGAKLSTDLELDLYHGRNMGTATFSGQTLRLDVNGTVKSIKLDDLNAFIATDGTLDFTATDSDGKTFETKLQDLVDKAFGTKRTWIDDKDHEDGGYWKTDSNVELGLSDNNKIKLDSDTSKIIVASSNNMLDVDEGNSNRVDLKTQIGSIEAFKNLQGDVFTFSINGAEISVSKEDTLSTLMSKIKSSDAGVDLTYSASTDEFTLTSKTTGAGENLDVQDVYGNFMSTLFGTKSGSGIGTTYLTKGGGAAVSQATGTLFDTITNSASGSEAMKTLGASLKYMAFEMTVDGVTKTVRLDTSSKAAEFQTGKFTASDVYNAINKGIKNAFGTDASVQFAADQELVDEYGDKIQYNPDGRMIIPDKHDESGNPIYFDQAGNKLSRDATDSYWYYLDEDDNEVVVADGDATTKKADYWSQWTGKTAVYGGGSAFTFEGGGVAPLLGLDAGTSNTASDDTKLGDLHLYRNYQELSVGSGTLTINGDATNQITYDENTTLKQLVDQITQKFGSDVVAELDESGKLSISGANGQIKIEDSGDMLKNLFGLSDSTYETTSQSSTYASRHKAGSNAEVIMDGRVHSYSSNTFTVNGVNITVNAVSEKGDAPITVDVASDVDDVVSRLKDWMDDYNALVYSLNSMINEGKNSDYFPLTDEQKADMTEDQINKWEAEAKKGILRNDSTLRSILAELRQSLYEKVDAAGISLFDIGITTKAYGFSDPNEAGQICFDENITGGGEAKLRAMLTSDPDKVRLLFADSNDGLATKMNDIISRAANASSINRGSLIDLAGTDQLTGNNTSILGDKISAIDKYIAALKVRLESEYTRQWKKFSTLETTVQKMNMQSSWFSQG